MPGETSSHALAPGSVDHAKAVPVIRVKAEIIEQRRNLRLAKTNEERYHLLVTILATETPLALAIQPSVTDREKNTVTYQQGQHDINTARAVYTRFLNHTPPTMAKPVIELVKGEDTYRVTLPPRHVIATIRGPDIPTALPVLLQRYDVQAYFDAIRPILRDWMSIQLILARWGVVDADTEVAMILSSYTTEDLNSTLPPAREIAAPVYLDDDGKTSSDSDGDMDDDDNSSGIWGPDDN